jgi:hypothetical protein
MPGPVGPAEALPSKGAGSGEFETDEGSEEPEVGLSIFGKDRDGRDIQAAADGFGNIAQRNTLFSDGVIFRAGLVLLESEPVELGCVEDMGNWPAILVPAFPKAAISNIAEGDSREALRRAFHR